MPVETEDLWPDRDPVELIRAIGSAGFANQRNLTEDIAELCRHIDADVRVEAIRVLTVRWKLPQFRDTAVDMVADVSEDREVRENAIYGLVALSTETTRRSDAKYLLDLVRDDNEDSDLKLVAYDGLVILFRRTDFPSMKKPFSPNRDIDWDWLTTLAESIGA